jgi:hypothetical protein
LQILPGVSFAVQAVRQQIRLQMRFDARCIRQASRRHGGLGLLSCIERTVSRAYTRGTKKKLFCSWSCNRPNHVLYYFMWGYEMTFKKKSAATVKVSGRKMRPNWTRGKKIVYLGGKSKAKFVSKRPTTEGGL